MLLSRSRKVACATAAAAMALGFAFTMPADAAAARVKGKFKVEDSGSPVLGSAKVKPLKDGTWLAGLTLQHVWRADYELYLRSFVDANGNGIPEGAEIQPDVHVASCDLGVPSKKGHAGCGKAPVSGIVGTVYMARLVPSQAGGDVPTAVAYLKK